MTSPRSDLSVLFLLPHPIEGPSSRFRVYQYVPYLEAHGIDCTLRPFLSSSQARALYVDGGLPRKVGLTLRGLAGRLRDILSARRHDVVFVLREAFALGPPAVERALMASGAAFVFDFDDAIYTPSLVHDNPVDRLRDFGKPAKIMARADTVIAGSGYLADWATRHGAARVEVLPTVVDETVYRPRPRNGDAVTVGWIGTPRGSQYVADLKPVFRDLARRHPAVRFVFIGCAPFPTDDLPIEFRDWSLEREPEDIAGFDIGIMPLTDDEETRGKCGFKLIQYMASGVVAVGSPVGVNTEIIEPGRSGFLAAGDDDWRGTLDRLISDPALRARVAQAGRERAVARYSLSYAAPRLASILREAGNRTG